MPFARRALLAVAVLLLVTSAHAFVFFVTEGGEPLRWKHTKTTMRTSTVAPEELDAAAVPVALAQAFASWDATGCVPKVTVGGTTDATEGSLPASTKGPADNILVFITTTQRWSQLGHGSKEIAVTVVANNPKTGEIVDADIEVNDGGFALSLADAPRPGEIDFLSTLTHEIGHFYGLDHSPETDATMFADYDPNNPTGKRTLSQDDIDGVCALYAIPFPAPDDGCQGGGSVFGGLGFALALMAWRARAARRLALALAVAPTLAACDDFAGSSTPQSHLVVSVAPLPPLDLTHDFQIDLGLRDATGLDQPMASDLSASSFGDGRALSWVGACAPGSNRLAVTVHDVSPAPEGLVEPGTASVPFTCVGGADTALDFGFELATLRAGPGGAAAIAFGDVRCSATPTCGAAGESLVVRCDRPGVEDGSVTLGVRGTRVVCGSLEVPIAPDGASQAFDASFDASAIAAPDAATWRVAAAVSDLGGCRLEAELMAAPELFGGHGPACVAWPTLAVAMPLDGSACAGAGPVAVGYRHGAEYTAAIAVDASGVHAPATPDHWQASCATTPAAAPEAGLRDTGGEGFFDLSFVLTMPTDDP
ncbi:MAG: matrixin family metalloprotease [Myxococcota bacterium]